MILPIYIRRVLLTCCAFVGSLPLVDGHAATMFLVSNLQGEVSAEMAGNEKSILLKGQFLPLFSKITTHAGEGLELLGSGWVLRMGQNTRFSILEGGVRLHEGSIMARRLRNSVDLILGTERTAIRIQGQGSWLAEVLEEDDLRIIGLTGDVRVIADSGRGRKRVELKSGQRVERHADQRFGNTIQLDLTELVRTSRLVGLFPNAASFDSEIAKASQMQSSRIVRTASPARVDIMMGLSYGLSTASTNAKQPNPPPLQKTVKSKTVVQVQDPPAMNSIASEQRQPAKVKPASSPKSVSGKLLPTVPGPPLLFHNRSKPEPTLKDFFQKTLAP